jgi:hypothetical protein
MQNGKKGGKNALGVKVEQTEMICISSYFSFLNPPYMHIIKTKAKNK